MRARLCALALAVGMTAPPLQAQVLGFSDLQGWAQDDHRAALSAFLQTCDKITDAELKDIYDNARILTWGDYDKHKAIQMKIINKNTKFPSDYNRLFYIYNEKEDIHGNKVEKKELFIGSQKRFIYYVPQIQK